MEYNKELITILKDKADNYINLYDSLIVQILHNTISLREKELPLPK